MHKINWYFKQSVAFADMRSQDDFTESAHQVGLKEGGHPVGIVSGYEVTPHTGMQVQIGATLPVAYDKLGHRLVPTGYPIIQSIASATGGGSTSVASGNERWVSVFARFGRRFMEAATDGSGNAVRKMAFECINALGEGSHGTGAYDATLAKEAGVDKFYIVAGTEDSVNTAVRPNLIDDGILICDIRVTNGMSTITAEDIFYDRQQRLVPVPVQVKNDWIDRYQAQDGAPMHGVDKYTNVIGHPTKMIWEVFDGRGYVDDGNAWAGPEFLGRYDFKYPVYVPAIPAHPSWSRIDLISVRPDGGLNIVAGAPGAIDEWHELAHPVAPAGCLPLMKVGVGGGATNTNTGPRVRASFRKAPFPFSTMTGIVQGCKLKWNWPAGETSTVYVSSPVNKILFNGELVEFEGGLDTQVTPQPLFRALRDSVGDPFDGAAGISHKPYYIYACRNQFQVTGDPAPPVKVSPVIIIESLMPFDLDTGHPMDAIGGPNGAIPATDCILIGVGWVRGASTNRVPVVVGPGDWYTPINNAFHNPVNIPGNSTNASFTMPGTPYGCLNVRATVAVNGDPTSTALMNVHQVNHAGSILFRIKDRATGGATTSSILGEYTFPMEGNDFITVSTFEVGLWTVQPVSYQVPIRRLMGTPGFF